MGVATCSDDMKYRAEIDGLRALAVFPVIFFHAGLEWFSGGFVGVDVFFVISGYLITTIIISEMAEGNFSIVNFYERRARRILPALFFVMAACLPFAWLWLSPSDLIDFGQSLVAVSTFSSNILFWMESGGYFDTAAELKPLLHTWSLAVEEQYYVLFPIFLFLTWRLGIKWILILLSLVFFVSLVVAQWGAYNKPSATFFLLPTRGWELLVGVFAAFYLKYNTYLKSHTFNQVLSLLGFSMIVYSIVSFDDSTPFPSLYALIPTLGTGLLILSAVPKTFIHKLLSLKPIVGIGLVSYSAYLWHQPLLAFARHRLLGETSEALLIALCIAALGMAWFSWHFVEKPFRSTQIFKRETVFALSFSSTLIFATMGWYLIHQSISTENNWSSDVRQHECFLQGDEEIVHAASCYEAKDGVLLWGDSHAASLSIGLRELYAEGTPFTQLTQSACPPMLDIEVGLRKTCDQINRRILNEVEKSNYSKVILHAAWVHPHYPMSKEEFKQKMILTLRALQKLNGVQVFIVGNVPRWSWHPYQIGKFEEDYLTISQFQYYEDKTVFDVDEIMVGLQRDYDFEYFSVINSICTYSNEKRYCPLRLSNRYIYKDWGHLTRYGSDFVASFLAPVIK